MKLFSSLLVFLSSLKLFGTKKISNQTENIFENMFREHNSIMLLVNPKNGKIIDANKSAIEFYGYSKEEFLNLLIGDINSLTKEEIEKKLLKQKRKETINLNFHID